MNTINIKGDEFMDIKNIGEIISIQRIVVNPGEKSAEFERKGSFIAVIVTEGEGRVEHPDSKIGHDITFDPSSIHGRIPRLTYMDGNFFVLVASPKSRAPLTAIVLQMMLTCKL